MSHNKILYSNKRVPSLIIGTMAFVLMASGIAEAQDLRVFVTSTQQNGNLGGLAGGDAVCEARATANTLGGTWRAWLSTSTVDAKDRLTEPAGVFTRAVSGTKVADDIADLTDGNIDNAILDDEFGVDGGNSIAWTGTGSDGLMTGSDCGDWTSSDSGDTGNRGTRSLSTTGWTVSGSRFCNTSQKLYCFEITPAPVPASDWRGMALLVILMLGGSFFLRRRYRTA